MWLTPGKGNLEEQSKAKMDKYIHASQTKLLSDVMTAGFEENDSCFINWEKLTKKGTRNPQKALQAIVSYAQKELGVGTDKTENRTRLQTAGYELSENIVKHTLSGETATLDFAAADMNAIAVTEKLNTHKCRYLHFYKQAFLFSFLAWYSLSLKYSLLTLPDMVIKPLRFSSSFSSRMTL